MADDDPRPDDDATRIYRPYGSPPPDDPPASSAPAPDVGPDPFAPDAPASGAPDPFSPDPFSPDPFAPDPPSATPDPFAPEPPPFPEPVVADPFAPDPPAPAAPDPFAPPPSPPAPDPFAPASAAPAADPFAPDSPAADPFAPSAPDPFAPDPPSAVPDPFVPSADPAPTAADPFAPDPFAPPAGPDPFRGGAAPPDPFAPPSASDPFAPPSASDPFAPPSASDPFAPPSASDPFAPPSASDPFAPPASAPDPFSPAVPAPEPTAPDPFDVTPADPFAPAPPVPAPAPPPRAPDPFSVQPGTATDDPFAAFKGPGLGSGGGAFDSALRDYPSGGDGGGVDLPDAFGTERTLAGAFTPVFSLILQLRAADRLGDGTALRQRIEMLLADAARAARDLGASGDDIDEATFAVVAFLDEAILATEWPGHDAWSAQPLQLTHYDRYDAGEQVFDRLKRLLDEGGTRVAVLEVYYLCLALGFKGRYAIHGREVLRRLVEDLHGRLERARGAVAALSPRGRSREVPTEAEKGGIPTWALWVGAAVLVALLYIGLSVSLSGAARDTADDLRSLSAETE